MVSTVHPMTKQSLKSQIISSSRIHPRLYKLFSRIAYVGLALTAAV